MAKLGLGAVQFGMKYGISNTHGRCTDTDIASILLEAHEQNISVIDTAASYGCSEQLLGRYLPKNHDFKLVTKLPVLLRDETIEQEVLEQIKKSLERLKQDKIYAVHVHDANSLMTKQGENIWQGMLKAKALGLIKKIGISVYTAKQLDTLLVQYSPDLIQLPFNVFDQRLLYSGHLAALKQQGIEIHARSLFLQGLLLMDVEHLPAYFQPIEQNIRALQQWAKESNMTMLELCLSFVLSTPYIDHAIIGVARYHEFLECCRAKSTKMMIDALKKFAIDNESILNPSLWSLP